jgi:hypothetical protein
VATCFNSFNINLFFNNLVRPLTRRQNDNLAPKLGKVAHACSKQRCIVKRFQRRRTQVGPEPREIACFKSTSLKKIRNVTKLHTSNKKLQEEFLARIAQWLQDGRLSLYVNQMLENFSSPPK